MPSEDRLTLVLNKNQILGCLVSGSAIVIPREIDGREIIRGDYTLKVEDRRYNLKTTKQRGKEGFYAIVGREC